MLNGDGQHEHMARAILTDGERAAVRDDPEMDASTKSSHLSRIRGKIPKVEEDARILRRHRPELYEQLRDRLRAEKEGNETYNEVIIRLIESNNDC